MLFNNTNMRTAMAYTNAVGDKVYPIIVDIKKGIKSTEEVSFVSSDINTGVLSVAFIQGNDTYNVEGAEVICSIMRPDTTTLEIPCNIINGNTIEVPLGVNGTSQDGVYSFDFKVFKGGNKIVGTPIMNYSVSLSISNDLVVEEDDRVPVLTMLITQVNELKEETRETINQANVATVASKEATANAIEATNNANAVSERVSQETATTISEIKQDTANAIASMNQNTSTAISTMNQSTTDAIASMNQNTTNAIASMTQKTDEALANMNQSATDAVTNMTQKTDEAVTSMNQNTTNAIADMTQKTNEAVTRINDNLANVNNIVTTKVTELDNAKSDMTTTVTNKVNEVETRFNRLTSSQQQSSEVIDARDGETSLKARLDRDIEKAKQVYVNVEGSHISTDSSVGYAKDVEILGNTIQSASNLADIRSVGDKVEGQELYEIPVLSVGKNLFNIEKATAVYLDGDLNILNVTDNSGVLTSGYIKVKPNTSYTVINGGFDLSSLPYNTWCTWGYFKDNKGTKSNIVGTRQGGDTGVKRYIKSTFTTPSDCNYIRIGSRFLTHEGAFIQLEEGTVATPYEPYQEDKLTILSPVQLEKVGDVADRIIEKDGVWGVEKNIVDTILNGSESDTSLLTCHDGVKKYFSFVKPGNIYNIKNGIQYYHITNKLQNGNPYNGVDNSFWLFYDGSNTQLRIRLDDSYTTKEQYIEWLKNNNILVKYITTQPQFIPLPHDQQVKLRTFANKTNISFGCEIEGTIKAQVPKSLGATVNTHTEQISNLNKELDRVKKLEESTVSTVETESDFTTVEATNGGYFEDVKLEGKTLVNKHLTSMRLSRVNANQSLKGDIVNAKVTTASYNHLGYDITNLKPNTKYKCIINLLTNNLAFIDGSNNIILKFWFMKNGFNEGYKVGEIGVKEFRFTTPNDVTNLTEIKFLGTDYNRLVDGGTYSFKMLLLEENEYCDTYFEGLKSVGQSATTSEDGADEIVVSSVNENLFDKNNCTYNINGGGYYISNYININDKIYYDIYKNLNATKIVYYEFLDKNKKRIYINYNVSYPQSGIIENTYGAKYIRLHMRHITTISKEEIDNNYGVIVSATPIDNINIEHQSDKKRLLYYNNETQSWEKPILRQWDSIEKHSDGKYYYHQRSGEAKYIGDLAEQWTLTSAENELGNIQFSIPNKEIASGMWTMDALCNNFSIRGHMSEPIPESIGLNGYGRITMISLNKSKLSTQDVAGFKQWLQANNVTVVYQLAEEKVYECTNIDLITYANETNYIVECGAIVPKTTLKVHNNISNVVKILQEKVSLLEDKFIQGLKQVLAGDMYSLAELLYPEDFVEENPENNIMLLPFE